MILKKDCYDVKRGSKNKQEVSIEQSASNDDEPTIQVASNINLIEDLLKNEQLQIGIKLKKYILVPNPPNKVQSIIKKVCCIRHLQEKALQLGYTQEV